MNVRQLLVPALIAGIAITFYSTNAAAEGPDEPYRQGALEDDRHDDDPDNTSETLDRTKNSAEQQRDQATDAAQQQRDRATDAVGQQRDRATDAVGQQRDRATDAAQQQRDRATDAVGQQRDRTVGAAERATTPPVSANRPSDDKESMEDEGSGGEQYVVERGDTLASIARDELGGVDQWERIAELNDIDDPKKLAVGTRLQLPERN